MQGMSERIRKGCLIVLGIYVIFAVMFCVLAHEQIIYTEETEVYAGSSSQTNLGEVADGTILQQVIETDGEYITEIAVYFATFDRENSGEVMMSLLDETGSLYASETVAYEELTDNSWYEWEIESRIRVSEGQSTVTLQMEFFGGETDNAVTVYCQLSDTDSLSDLIVNGESLEGQALCAMLVQQDDSWFADWYLLFFIAVFLILAAMCVRVLYCEKKRKKNFVLGIFHALERYQFLIEQLVSRDFKTKYKRSVFGVLWSLLNPLLTMSVQYIVFSRLFRFNIENYSVYLLTGIVVFNAFSDATTQAMNAIVGNASLITKVYVPKYIYPVTKVLSSSINLLFSLIPLLLVTLITGVPLTWNLLLLPYGIVTLILFCIGLSFALSAAMVFFRDMQFLWGVLTMMWQYATPIIYDMSTIEGTFLYPLQSINPLYRYVTFFRTILLEGVSPRPEEYLICLVMALLALAVGGWIFKKTQGQFILHL